MSKMEKSNEDNCLLKTRCFCSCLICVGDKNQADYHCEEHRYGCHYACGFMSAKA